MKERPILFSGAMVRAILEGRKTQARRVVKNPPAAQFCGLKSSLGYPASEGSTWAGFGNPSDPMYVRCPYGQPGDRLWVKESFWGCDLPGYGDQPCVVYDDEWTGKDYHPAEARPWARRFGRIPSIHMPRDACRLVLEVTGVRVERLQSISEDDALAEGIDTEGDDYLNGEGWKAAGSAISPERYAFASLWRRINGDASWDANPWVWVVEFRKVAHG